MNVPPRVSRAVPAAARGRRVRATAAALLALATLLAAPAAARAGAWEDAANALRATAGLPAVTAHDAAARAAAIPGLTDPQLDPEWDWMDATGRDPDADAGQFGFVAGPQADPAAYFAAQPAATAMVLDPRVRTLDEVSGGGAHGLVVTVDPTRPWTDPIAVRTTVDLLAGQEPLFAIPPNATTATLQRMVGGAWVDIATDVALRDNADAVSSMTGAIALTVRAVDLDQAVVRGFPFGARLRLAVAGGARPAEVATAPMPAAVAARSFRFEPAVSAAQRRAFVAAVRADSTAAQALLGVLDGFTTIGLLPADSPYGGLATEAGDGRFLVQILPSVLSGPAADRDFVINHELGHVVRFAAIGGRDLEAIDALVTAGSRCVAYDAATPDAAPADGCADAEERFATTFARWALKLRVPAGSGSDVPSPASFPVVGGMIRRGFTFALPSGSVTQSG